MTSKTKKNQKKNCKNCIPKIKNLIGQSPTGTLNQLISIEIRNLNSDFIRDVIYSNGDLLLTFRDGHVYRYLKFDPKKVMEFINSKSYGKYFKEKIKCVPSERLA
jgi:hypothetical protein